MGKKTLAIFGILLLAFTFSIQFVSAVNFDSDISDEDKEVFDEILEPVMKIYNFVKYSATVIAVMVLLFAGIVYITAGADPGKREKAKNMATYVIVGLVVIWAAPLIVNFIVG
jgi:hypothetical protein